MSICPATFTDCTTPCDCSWLCRRMLIAPIFLLHFVGFRNPTYHKDPRYDAAVRAFGPPDVVHRVWDTRAQQDIAPGDVVVFAKGDEHTPPTSYTYDDSHDDYVVAAGGDRDR